MTEKRHGKSKEKYSVILRETLPNSIQIAISKDFAEDSSPMTSVLRLHYPTQIAKKSYDGRQLLCYFKCSREPFTMIYNKLQLPIEQFFIFYFLTFHFCF